MNRARISAGKDSSSLSTVVFRVSTVQSMGIFNIALLLYLNKKNSVGQARPCTFLDLRGFPTLAERQCPGKRDKNVPPIGVVDGQPF
jgi:hypothetical protein